MAILRREITHSTKMSTQLWKVFIYTRHSVISLFFTAERSVKAWIILNCLKKMTFAQNNTNFIDLFYFIDFLSGIFVNRIWKNLLFNLFLNAGSNILIKLISWNMVRSSDTLRNLIYIQEQFGQTVAKLDPIFMYIFTV